MLCVTHDGHARHDTANSQCHPEMSPLEDLLPTKGIHICFIYFIIMMDKFIYIILKYLRQHFINMTCAVGMTVKFVFLRAGI